MRLSAEERFWAKVTKTAGCWLWTGCVVRRYGQFGVSPGVSARAHRFSYELAYGPIPEGMFVCHKCDTPLCVNPTHLFLGTNSDNQLDAVQKGLHHRTRQTHCKRGHEFTPDNTIRKIRRRNGRLSNQRTCRACSRLLKAIYRGAAA